MKILTLWALGAYWICQVETVVGHDEVVEAVIIQYSASFWTQLRLVGCSECLLLFIISG